VLVVVVVVAVVVVVEGSLVPSMRETGPATATHPLLVYCLGAVLVVVVVVVVGSSSSSSSSSSRREFSALHARNRT